MNIDEAFLAIGILHDAGVPGYMWGLRGLGKTQSIRTYCANSYHFESTVRFGYRDVRCAQLESSDLRGLPTEDLANKATIYLPPSDLPRHEFIDEDGSTFGNPGDKMPETSPNGKKVTLWRGILALEELNRAEDDVLQAVFELILDRKCGGYTLPTGWGIMATGNYAGAGYRVNSMMSDPAMMDRWSHLFIQLDEEYKSSWMAYMNSLPYDPATLEKITQFAAFSESHLITQESTDDVVITPSPRSWEFVARIEDAVKRRPGCSKKLRREIIAGVVGVEVANMYVQFTADVLPQDIISTGLTEAIKIKLKKADRSTLYALVFGVGQKAAKMTAPTSSECINVLGFARWLMDQKGSHNDLATAYFRLLIQENLGKNVKDVALINPSVQNIMRKMGTIKNSIWLDKITQEPDFAKAMRTASWGGEVELDKVVAEKK